MNIFNVVYLVWTLCIIEVWSCAIGDGFSEQATQLFDKLRLSDEQKQAVPLVVRDLQKTLNTRWPGCQVSVYGSLASGLALRQSDIDLSVMANNTDNVTAAVEEGVRVLGQHPELFAELRTQLTSRLHPIITCKHIPSGYYLDINFKAIEGPKNTELVRYFVNSDECLLHLTVILKHWAKLHKITASEKHFPSYGMVLLVIFYLQQKEILPPVSLLQANAKPYLVDHWNIGFDKIVYEHRNNATLYQLMGGFFEYYNDFDFRDTIISTFVAHPLKRRLFENLQNVPTEFSLYRHNVGLNITKPLNVTRSSCIQDPFFHNKRVKIDSSLLKTQLKRATITYRKNNWSLFLDQILSSE